MEPQLISAVLHGHRLGEHLTWKYLAALAAVVIADWGFDDVAFEPSHRVKDED
ncbi:hypothetical protein ACFSHT_19735 [Paraburkholderia silviterrae]|uniref:hypothetical protein n=1 Tax=Paraburkholderia silviterrae TaxID=2528715 RepID=UPI0014050E33|nr:hypothetical protein [Paraburkholderia silviterrae]